MILQLQRVHVRSGFQKSDLSLVPAQNNKYNLETGQSITGNKKKERRKGEENKERNDERKRGLGFFLYS